MSQNALEQKSNRKQYNSQERGKVDDDYDSEDDMMDLAVLQNQAAKLKKQDGVGKLAQTEQFNQGLLK